MVAYTKCGLPLGAAGAFVSDRIDVRRGAQNGRDALLDRAEVPAQINATVPAFGGSYRSDDLCASAVREPGPTGAFRMQPAVSGRAVSDARYVTRGRLRE